MKYILVYLIKGKAQRYQSRLMKEISSKFNVYNMNKKIPCHLTLKSPFESENIKEIEEKLRSFCKKEKVSRINLEGLGNFEDKVIYLKYIFSDDAKKVFRNFIKSFSEKKYFSWHEYDLKEDNFHATISCPKSKDKFDEINYYLLGIYPKYELVFDNIAIFKKSKDKWKLHRKFKIK